MKTHDRDAAPDLESAQDWTAGVPALCFQRCPGCGQVSYFRRAFCPGCGARHGMAQRSAGFGVVHATTVVHRASLAEFRALAPSRLVLADMDEGFRIMAHAPLDMAIGQRIRCAFRLVAGHLVPYAELEEMP
jgi:uncharacterized OB-fold protein